MQERGAPAHAHLEESAAEWLMEEEKEHMTNVVNIPNHYS